MYMYSIHRYSYRCVLVMWIEPIYRSMWVVRNDGYAEEEYEEEEEEGKEEDDE